MKDILITISGDRQVGKTTMAKVLGKFLKLFGCEVSYEDVNPMMTRTLNDFKDDVNLSKIDPWNVKIKST
ncbi:MAG TPA: hypothetical protein VKR58_10230 [Aquella sp.]|nr:hypothetical protein [Aquella sp.]